MLTITDLVKSYAEDRRGKGPMRVRAVDGVSINVAEGDFFTLLGPSGCGKTTTLRSVAGLEEPDSGRIEVGNRVLFESGQGLRRIDIPANKRGLGMVFQSYAIWPHMSVFDNAAFPLRATGTHDRKRVHETVMRVLETMELGHLAERRATKLSGGQQQRLALARAIVSEPPMLLLDEPLSNLDAKLRENLRFEIKRLQHDLGITTLYVTHDQTEALAMSTRIAVMNRGRIVQLGTPREIYETPATTFVAQFIGASNLVSGTATADGAATSIGPVLSTRSRSVTAGEAVRVACRPESIRVLEDDAPAAPNRFRGSVVTSSYVGEAIVAVVRIADVELKVRCRSSFVADPGAEVQIEIRPEEVAVLPDDVAGAAAAA